MKQQQQQSLFCGMISSNNQSNEETLQTETVKDLMTELVHVRKQVFREHRWFQRTGTTAKTSLRPQEWLVLVKRRRLLFLFMKDLSTGVSGEALSTKSERDCSVGSLKTRAMLDSVSWKVQLASWVFVILLNVGLLFYVYLFALNQTHSRQSAWFQSFVMWLVFEVTVSSTGLVVLTHLLIPLYVLADVSKIKEKVVKDLIFFRESLRSSDIEAGRRIGVVAGEGGEVFNAAKYLFPSWRLASLFPELPESGLILKFSTPWPKRKFGGEEAKVSTEYEQAVILTALSRILLYFLGSLLHLHTVVQDIFLQTVCNSGLGVLGMWMIRLFATHPALPVAVGMGLLLVLGYFVRISSGWNHRIRVGVEENLASLSSSHQHRDQPPPLCSTPAPLPLSQEAPLSLTLVAPSSTIGSCAEKNKKKVGALTLGDNPQCESNDDNDNRDNNDISGGSSSERSQSRSFLSDDNISQQRENECMWSDGGESEEPEIYLDSLDGDDYEVEASEGRNDQCPSDDSSDQRVKESLRFFLCSNDEEADV
jgi:hypothetical protein